MHISLLSPSKMAPEAGSAPAPPRLTAGWTTVIPLWNEIVCQCLPSTPAIERQRCLNGVAASGPASWPPGPVPQAWKVLSNTRAYRSFLARFGQMPYDHLPSTSNDLCLADVILLRAPRERACLRKLVRATRVALAFSRTRTARVSYYTTPCGRSPWYCPKPAEFWRLCRTLVRDL